jgi:hypothetical protein
VKTASLLQELDVAPVDSDPKLATVRNDLEDVDVCPLHPLRRPGGRFDICQCARVWKIERIREVPSMLNYKTL